MESKWYYSSYITDDEDFCPDGEYFMAENDEMAIALAKQMAENGQDYPDCGHIDLSLLSVVRVDPDNGWQEIETIWF